MSSTMEDRLVAALEARAALVTPEDLGPVRVPDPPKVRGRGVVVLLAAAACAAAVAAPFALGGGGGESDIEPGGSPSVTPSQEPPEPAVPATPGKIVDRQRADVDGDGRPDRVLLVVDDKVEAQATGAVEIYLATGETGAAALPVAYPPTLLPPYDINGDGQEQLLLTQTAGGDESSLLVYSWYDGELVQLRPEGDAPLALGLDGEGAYTHYYRDSGLYSWLRLDPVEPTGWPMFHVKRWSWAVDGDQLVPTQAGQACVDATSEEPPAPCG